MREASWSKLLETWKQEWEATDGSVPFPIGADRALAALGSSVFAVKIECARAMGIKPDKRTKPERALVDFYSRVHAVQESVLQERMMGHPAGQVHLAKAKHGMIIQEKLEVTGKSLDEVILGGN